MRPAAPMGLRWATEPLAPTRSICYGSTRFGDPLSAAAIRLGA